MPWHAPVRNFNCLSVYDFSQTNGCGEAGINYFQKRCPYDCFHIGRVRAVEPSYVAAAVFPFASVHSFFSIEV